MDVDIMNQEESKLKPLASELDSSLTSAITTGRDQPSSSATLRHRHPPFDQSIYPPLRFSSTETSGPEQSFVPTLTDTHRSMEPSAARAPAPAPSYITMAKESALSPSDISGPSTSPEALFRHPLYAVQEDEGPYDDDADQDGGMDVDELGGPKPQVESRGQPSNGDAPKGLSQKNFVYKLFQMMEDPEAKSYIQWNSDGREFIVTNQEEFAPKILSKHFKHSNFSSFVRQLNMYDFHKTNRAPRSQRGTVQHQLWIFSHPRFQRNRPDLLHGIKRKANEGGPILPGAGEDQLQTERRSSFVQGLRSPPNGLAISSDPKFTDLQQENADLKSRVYGLEVAYNRLESKLNELIRMFGPRGQQQPPLDAREPVRPGIMASTSMQPQTHEEHFDCNVPSSLGPVNAFQHPPVEVLQSPTTESQSPVTPFHTTAEPPNTFVSGHSAPGPSRRSSSATNISPTGSISNNYAAGLTGSSSYQPVQHQSTPVSLRESNFLSMGFNPSDPGPYFVGHPGQGFPPSIAPTIPPNQNRMLGSRGYTVTRTPAKAGPLATVPKAQPPDSSGGLFQFH